MSLRWLGVAAAARHFRETLGLLQVFIRQVFSQFPLINFIRHSLFKAIWLSAAAGGHRRKARHRLRRECGSSWLCVYSPSSSSFCCADPTLKRELLVFVGGSSTDRSALSALLGPFTFTTFHFVQEFFGQIQVWKPKCTPCLGCCGAAPFLTQVVLDCTFALI